MRFYSGDNMGAIQESDNKIIRSAYDEYKDRPGMIYNLYEKYALKEYGVVATEFDAAANQLHHEKHLLTYPHEWPPAMLKDAVLFHLDLLLHLHRHGLTLKDALPENILFEGVRPVFVDFFSILPEEDLDKESWLADYCPPSVDLRLHALRLMFVPHMLIPLLCYALGDFAKGAALLAERFCNNASGKIPAWADLPRARWFRHRFNPRRARNYFLLRSQVRAIQRICLEPDVGWPQRICRLRALVDGLNVAPPESGYAAYYEDKKENLGFGDDALWREKQHSVRRILCDARPKTVLDLGANTGWFSRLACRLGASVVASDIDVACADMLYRTAAFCRLPLTPLCLSFDGLLVEHFAGGNSSLPVHAAALKRLRADCVLCLGLLHHLTLGLGKSFADVLARLAALTRDTLVLEFVSLRDKLIQNEPGFFPNIASWSLETYNLEAVKLAAAGFFGHCSELPSTPVESRTLLVLKR